MKKKRILDITYGAMIAALYAVLTLMFAPISFGAVQLRVSEALTVLPMYTPAAVPGLFIGCIIANILGGAIIPDIIFGSLATLIGAAAARLLRFNRWLVPIPAVVSNTIIIPLVLRYGYGVDLPLIVSMLYIAIGELLSSYVLGEMLITLINKTGIFKDKAK